ncbi:MAG: 3-oxoacyl-ACP synthase, partial [Anaerolineae bacterium]|nr:3-oxoacyl-ACP synthase [Anaerolineae bacterium]
LGGNKPSAMHNGWPAHWVSPAEAFEKGHHHMAQMFKNELRDSMREENGLTIFTNGVARMVDRCGIDLSKLKFF